MSAIVCLLASVSLYTMAALLSTCSTAFALAAVRGVGSKQMSVRVGWANRRSSVPKEQPISTTSAPTGSGGMLCRTNSSCATGRG
eukprot:394706-Pleurochrysis_carterae.AAC.1